jgi:hypothetical protein
MRDRLLTALIATALMLIPTQSAHAGEETNFASRCGYSHSSHDDPIVFPGQPGATHLHDFFGNETTDASSTYESLRRGGTTCMIEQDTAAYWAPALYDSGKLIQPMRTTVYYRLAGKPRMSVRAFPARLRVVAKDDNVRARWVCDGGGDRVGRASATVPTCPSDTHLVALYAFPDCWDGRHLDSPDHTSHMAFARKGSCPSSHPKPMPAISVNIHYPSDGGNIVLGDPDMPVAPHADFFNAWDQPTLERLVRECLNAGRHCGAKPPGT